MAMGEEGALYMEIFFTILITFTTSLSGILFSENWTYLLLDITSTTVLFRARDHTNVKNDFSEIKNLGKYGGYYYVRVH